jgi:hypothetical protein
LLYSALNSFYENIKKIYEFEMILSNSKIIKLEKKICEKNQKKEEIKTMSSFFFKKRKPRTQKTYSIINRANLEKEKLIVDDISNFSIIFSKTIKYLLSFQKEVELNIPISIETLLKEKKENIIFEKFIKDKDVGEMIVNIANSIYRFEYYIKKFIEITNCNLPEYSNYIDSQKIIKNSIENMKKEKIKIFSKGANKTVENVFGQTLDFLHFEKNNREFAHQGHILFSHNSAWILLDFYMYKDIIFFCSCANENLHFYLNYEFHNFKNVNESKSNMSGMISNFFLLKNMKSKNHFQMRLFIVYCKFEKIDNFEIEILYSNNKKYKFKFESLQRLNEFISKIEKFKESEISNLKELKNKIEKIISEEDLTDIEQQRITMEIENDNIDINIEKEYGLKTLKIIGEGGMGSIFLCENEFKQKYALKKIYIQNFNDLNNNMNEIMIGKLLKHENIVDYIDVKFQKERIDKIDYFVVCILMDFFENGDLNSYIKKRNLENRIFEENEVIDLFLQLTNGLMILHKNSM